MNSKKLDILENQFYDLKKTDIYALDNLFLTNLEKEPRSLVIHELSTVSLGFLLLKGVLYLKNYNSKIILKLKQKLFIELVKKSKIEILKQFFELDSVLSLKLNEEIYNESFFEQNYNFYIKEKNDKEEIIISGGILDKKLEVQNLISNKYQELDLKNRKGKFFIRTETHSFLYPIGESKLKNFFIQEKNPISKNFLFYILKLENEIKQK